MSYYSDKKSRKSGSEGGMGGKKFRDSREALQSVLYHRGTDTAKRGSVSKIEVESGKLKNGIEHCTVQVLCSDGAGYRIDAFGDEARELCRLGQSYTAPRNMSGTGLSTRMLIPFPMTS